MHRKPTTKFPFILVSIFSAFLMLSCGNPDDDSSPKDELWESMIGTWIRDDTQDILEITDESFKIGPYVFSREDVVTVADVVEYNNAPDKKHEDGTTYVTRYEPAKQAFQNVLQKYPHFHDCDLCFYDTEVERVYDYYENKRWWTEKYYISSFYAFSVINDKLHVLDYSYRRFTGLNYNEITYTLKQTSGSDNENNPGGSTPETSITPSDITGSYTISGANGSTITFASDGTWTYNYNSRTEEGRWSVSDGELEMTYSLNGYSSTAAFAVSVSDDIYTLTGKSGAYQTIIASVFKITDQTAMQDGVVTLVRK